MFLGDGEDRGGEGQRDGGRICKGNSKRREEREKVAEKKECYY